MNEHSIRRLDTPAAAELARVCCAHLDSEIALLQELLQVSRDIQSAVGQADQAAVDALLARHQRLTEQTGGIGHRRQAVRQALAAKTGLSPEQATISAALPSFSESDVREIEERRNQIAALALEVQQLNQTNYLLLQQSMGIYQRIIGALTGGMDAPACYTPQGGVAAHTGSIMIQTRY